MSHSTIDKTSPTKMTDLANNVWLLLTHRIVTLVVAPLLLYLFMQFESSVRELKDDVVDLRIAIVQLKTMVSNNIDDIKDLKRYGNDGNR